MPFIIHPYRKFVFWIRTITFGSFYLPIIFSLVYMEVSMMLAFVLVLTPIALLMTRIFIRDRVFTFQDHTLIIKSALDFYPFNRMFKKYTFDYDQIDQITLKYCTGRFWGVAFTLDEKSDPPIHGNAINIEAKVRGLKSKRHSFFIENMQRHKMFRWDAALQSMGIKVIVKE